MKRYSIYLTKQCNCRCLYCYQTDYSSIISQFEIMKQIEQVKKRTSKNEYVVVELICGETLLKMNLVLYCYEQLNSYFTNIEFYISTNLTFIPKELYSLLDKKNVTLFVSIDGDKDGNSLRIYKNKLFVFKDVTTNIKKLVSGGYGNKLVAHVVVHYNNVYNLSYHVSFIQRLNVSMVDVGIIEGYYPIITKKFCDAFIKEHETISREIKMGIYKNNVSTLLFPPKKTYRTGEEKIHYLLRKTVYEKHKEEVKQ